VTDHHRQAKIASQTVTDRQKERHRPSPTAKNSVTDRDRQAKVASQTIRNTELNCFCAISYNRYIVFHIFNPAGIALKAFLPEIDLGEIQLLTLNCPGEKTRGAKLV